MPSESITRQTILKAAHDTTRPFTLEWLAVACWTLDKPAFGLAGFEQAHPDPRIVGNALYGERGLIRQGWLERNLEELLEPTGKLRQYYREASLEAMQEERDAKKREDMPIAEEMKQWQVGYCDWVCKAYAARKNLPTTELAKVRELFNSYWPR